MKNSTRRVALHRKAVRRVLRKLWRLGMPTRQSADHARGDIVAGNVVLAVRAASTSVAPRHYTNAKGQHVVYRYPCRCYSLHEHNVVKQHPDLWVLVEAGGLHCYVIPDRVARTRKTVQQHQGRTRRGSWLDEWRDRFDLVTHGNARRRAA